MKVLMDFRKYDGVVGGVEQGAIQVTKYLGANGHAAVLICKKSRLDQVKEIFEGFLDNLKIIPLDVNTHSMTRENARLDSTTIQDIAIEEKADVIHFFYNWSFPENKKVPCVLTVHDVIPFTFREAQKLFINLFKYKPGIRKACRLNDIITTVSEFSRQDIAQKVGVSLSKIKVVHNGLREPFAEDKDFEKELAKKFDLSPRFILNVGGIHERKNIVRLIESFASLVNKHGYAGKLVITGKVSGAPYQEKMKKLCDKAIADNKMTDRVIFTGFTSEKELDSLFRMADLLIYPSLYEGFGIPILEAMKTGTPVITSNVTAMPGVAGDAGLIVDPYNVEDMTEGMLKIINNPELREELKEKGYKRSESFTWEKTAKEYLSVYEEVISKNKM